VIRLRRKIDVRSLVRPDRAIPVDYKAALRCLGGRFYPSDTKDKRDA
jgi:hypothetical protein